jgi:hypothetical protein
VRNAWNSLELHVLNALPKGRTFDAEYYRDNTLTALVSLRPEAGERKPVTHVDNARGHTAQKGIVRWKDNGLPVATHPPYSPGLALSD